MTLGSKTTRNNILANGVGRLWAVLSNIIFVPLYLVFLGRDAYGLIIFYATLTATVQVLDTGLSSALARELALRLSLVEERGEEALKSVLNLTRTLEVLSWSTGVVVGIGVVLAAPAIATYWLRSGNITLDHAVYILRLMGIVLAVQWPSTAYGGALQGSQRQVQYNFIKTITTSAQSFGIIFVLWKISATLESYFFVVLASQLANTIWLRRSVWNNLEMLCSDSPNFRWIEVTKVWRFGAGIASISVLGIILSQADKIILSKMVTLSEFAAYGVAVGVAAVLPAASGPILTAVMPRFTHFFATGKIDEAGSLYIKSGELVALITVPGWVILQFHTHSLMVMWMGAGAIADQASVMLRVLCFGWFVNALVILPYGMQLSVGWTSLSVIKNAVAVLIVFPCLLVAIPRYGGVGAGAVWVLINLIDVFISIPIMHGKILRGYLFKWYAKASVGPAVFGALFGVISDFAIPDTNSRIGIFIFLSILFALTFSGLAMVLPSVRSSVLKMMRNRWRAGFPRLS